MLLDDLPSVKELFTESLVKPVSLAPMLSQIREAIIKKQPAIGEFLCAAVQAGLINRITDDAGRSALTRIINHTYVLNILTEEIAQSKSFMDKVQTHLLQKRAALGIRSDLVGSLEDLKKLYRGQMFGPTKVVSVDWMYSLALQVRTAGATSPEAIHAFEDGIKLNILEASVTENQAGFYDNAMAGIALEVIAPKTVTVTQDEKQAWQWDFSERWNSLYETWNLAFITGNSTYLNLYYPKLLIPAVIGADRMDYLSNRAYALWMSLNFRQFVAAKKIPEVVIPHKEELAKLWGSINVKYGRDLVQKEKEQNLDDLSGELNITLEKIMEQVKDNLATTLSSDDAQKLMELYNY
jgi:hypothetical protein